MSKLTRKLERLIRRLLKNLLRPLCRKLSISERPSVRLILTDFLPWQMVRVLLTMILSPREAPYMALGFCTTCWIRTEFRFNRMRSRYPWIPRLMMPTLTRHIYLLKQRTLLPSVRKAFRF